MIEITTQSILLINVSLLFSCYMSSKHQRHFLFAQELFHQSYYCDLLVKSKQMQKRAEEDDIDLAVKISQEVFDKHISGVETCFERHSIAKKVVSEVDKPRFLVHANDIFGRRTVVDEFPNVLIEATAQIKEGLFVLSAFENLRIYRRQTSG